MIPILHTDRLVLRAFREDDLDVWAGYMADPETMHFIGGPMARTDAWRSMASALGHWALRGYGMWAVERKADGLLIGRVGLLQPEGWTGLEVGWTLGREHWGHGYATEAAVASMRYAFLTQPVDHIVSNIDPDNLPSQAVAKRLGETKGTKADLTIGGHVYAVDVWSIRREEWSKRA